MLPPASTDEQVDIYEDNFLEVALDNLSEPVRAADGFTFTQQYIQGLPPKQRSTFGDPALIQANIFYRKWLWEEMQRLRTAGFSVTDALKRVDLVKPGTVLKDGRSDQGWGAYRTLVLTLFGRPGGIMALVKDVMLRHRATPADQWRNARDQNRVSHLVILGAVCMN